MNKHRGSVFKKVGPREGQVIDKDFKEEVASAYYLRPLLPRPGCRQDSLKGYSCRKLAFQKAQRIPGPRRQQEPNQLALKPVKVQRSTAVAVLSAQEFGQALRHSTSSMHRAGL